MEPKFPKLPAKPLTKEYQYIPNWQINISMPTTEVTSSKDNLYFKLGQTLGYFSENGEITHYKSFPSKAAISQNYYALYSSNAKDIPFFDKNGNQVGIIQAEGYPMFDENRIFVFYQEELLLLDLMKKANLCGKMKIFLQSLLFLQTKITNINYSQFLPYIFVQDFYDFNVALSPK